MIIAWLAAIILSIVYWKRHPAVSLLTLVAMMMFIIATLVNAFFTTILPITFNIGARNYGVVLGVGRVFTTLLNVSAWIMVIIVIFGWRKPRATETK